MNLYEVLNMSKQAFDDMQLRLFMAWCERWSPNAKGFQIMCANTAISNFYSHHVAKQTDKFMKTVDAMNQSGVPLEPEDMARLYHNYMEHGVWNIRPNLDEITRAKNSATHYDPKLHLIIYNQLNAN